MRYHRIAPLASVLCALVVAGLALGYGSSVQAATPIYVNAATGNDAWDGEAPTWDGIHGPKQTIEAGIAVVDVGGTVRVATGTYTPAGGRLVINKTCTVQAEPAAPRPKINTNHAGWSTCAIQIAADNVVLDGFEVDNSAAGSYKGYIVGDYNVAKNGWTVRNCDIHNGRNAIRLMGNSVTIEYNDLHETDSDLVNAEYGTGFGLKVRYNWLHSHHQDLGGKPAGLTYNVSSSPGADVEVTYNYAWANRTFIDFQNNGGLSPANHILVAHNTVDFWIGDLPSPVTTQNGEQMSIAWWTNTGNWNAPNFEIRDNLFTRQRWYAIVDTDSLLQGQMTLHNNLFWGWYLRDDWYPGIAYPNEWPGPRGAVGWNNMGAGNEFVMTSNLTGDPLYAMTGATPDRYYALRAGSPAFRTASDGTSIGAWQGIPTAVTLTHISAHPRAVNTLLTIALGVTLARVMTCGGLWLYRQRKPRCRHFRGGGSIIAKAYEK